MHHVEGRVGNEGSRNRTTDLDHLVPTTRHDNRVHNVRAEAHTRHPVIASQSTEAQKTRRSNAPFCVAVLLNIVLAFTKGVPELDRAVARAGDDLTVVGAEADGEDVGGVADKATSREAGVEVPEAERVVPRGGQGELAVGGDDDVRDEVVVAFKDSLRVAVRVLVARQLPDDDRLVFAAASARGRAQARTRTDAPRDAVRIMSGFSDEVAMAVTQPLWPGSDPRKRRLSMLNGADGGRRGCWAGRRDARSTARMWTRRVWRVTCTVRNLSATSSGHCRYLQLLSTPVRYGRHTHIGEEMLP
jgi:hypothetical protein